MRTKQPRKKKAVQRATKVVIDQIDEQFTPIVAAFQNEARVSLARMFGSVGLKVNGKVFVMLVKGDLVAKLSKQ